MNISKFRPVIIIFIIAVLTEVMVFNLRHWDSLFYQPQMLEITNVYDGLKKMADNTYRVVNPDNAFIDYENINAPIKNIYVNIKNSTEDKAIITPYATDEGNELYFKMQQREIAPMVERSKYIRFNTAGNSQKLRLGFEKLPAYNLSMDHLPNEDAEYNFTIKEVVINKTVPFCFIPIRFAVIFSFLLLMYAIRYRSSVYGIIMDSKSIKQRLILLAVIAINILFAYFIYKNNKYFSVNDRKVYQNLAQALINGHFDLYMLPVDKQLAAMPNPYDANLRGSMQGMEYSWDYAFFNGKYYVYFGIVPCLILFLPLKLLFDYDIGANMAMLVFMCIYIPLAFMFVKRVLQRFFKKISFMLYLLSAEVFVFCSAMSYFSMRNDLYGLPMITGLVFTLAGLMLWLKSVDERGCINSVSSLAAGSLCMALVAGCRPQLLVGSFFAVPIFWNSVFKKRELLGAKNKGIIKTIAFILPYIIVAAGLMYYNYERFGSVFDFGANYNLTTNDMTKRGFRLDRLPYGFYAFLFQLPNISFTFPFLEHCPPVTKYMGVTIYETVYGGIFAIIPITLLCLCSYTRYVRDLLKQNRLLLPITLCYVFSVLIVAADVNMAGVVVRYMSDFAWMMIIAAVCVFFTLHQRLEGAGRRLLTFGFSIGCVVSLVLNLLICFMRYRNYGMDFSNPEVFYNIMYAIQFWM